MMVLPEATCSPSCEAPYPGAEWSCCFSSSGRWKSPPWQPIRPKPRQPSVSEQNLEEKDVILMMIDLYVLR